MSVDDFYLNTIFNASQHPTYSAADQLVRTCPERFFIAPIF